jgi:hypothetical protein
MKLYEEWCDCDRIEQGRKTYLKYVEKNGGRDAVRKKLTEVVRNHYDTSERIAADVVELGYDGAAAILRELLPAGSRARSGDLGEILASELTQEVLDFEVPVRRMRYKDGREVPMRGDDFIGVNVSSEGGELWLLKGEAKSRRNLQKGTISEAREALNRCDGRCTPSSLLFVANRLLEGSDEDAELGRLIRNEVGRKALRKDRIDHALFTMSGNTPPQALEDDLAAADAGRHHTVINLRIEDHPHFIADIYEGAGKIGDD